MATTGYGVRVDQERRIGQRWPAPGLDVAWNVGATRSTWRGRKPEAPQEGRVVDVSVSGASIEARTDERLASGTQLVIGFEREVSRVVVRRVSGCEDDRDQSIYGVEFLDAPAHMVSDLMESVTGRDNEAREHRWNRSG